MESFNVFDYMGSRYSKMANQIVYLKFNNTKHHAIPKYKYKTRVMPALFLPFKEIYNGEFKIKQELEKHLFMYINKLDKIPL